MHLPRKKSGLAAVLGVASALVAAPFTPASAQVHPFSAFSSGSSNLSHWLSDVTLIGQIEGRIMANPARPNPGYHFGGFLADPGNVRQPVCQVGTTTGKS